MAVSVWVEIEMEVVAGQLAGDQFNAANLNDAIAVFGRKTSRFGIQKNLSHGLNYRFVTASKSDPIPIKINAAL
jgi:hypothetical protein